MNQHACDECVICYDNKSNKSKCLIEKLDCGHSFHVDCFNTWCNTDISHLTNKDITCPLCRTKMDISKKQGLEINFVDPSTQKRKFKKYNIYESNNKSELLSTLTIYQTDHLPHDCNMVECYKYTKYKSHTFITFDYNDIKNQLINNDIPSKIIRCYYDGDNKYSVVALYEIRVGKLNKCYYITPTARSQILYGYYDNFPLIPAYFKGTDGSVYKYFKPLIFSSNKALEHNLDLYNIVKSYKDLDTMKYIMFLNSLRIINIDYYLNNLMIRNDCLDLMLNTNLISLIYDYNMIFDEFKDIDYYKGKYDYDLATIVNIVFILRTYNLFDLFDNLSLLGMFKDIYNTCNCDHCCKIKYIMDDINKHVETRKEEMTSKLQENRRKILFNCNNKMIMGNNQDIIFPVS